MAIKPVICENGNKPFVPECDPCDEFEARVEALEQTAIEHDARLDELERFKQETITRLDTIETLLSNYDDVVLTKRDTDGRVVEAHVLGRVVEVQDPVEWTWSGLGTLYVNVGEEFDPLNGVSVTSSQGDITSLTVREG